MDWIDLSVTVPTEHLEQAAAIAQMLSGAGISIEDYSDLEEKTLEIAHIDLIDEALLKKDRASAVIHLYLPSGQSPAEPANYLKERLEAGGIPFSLSSAGVREEDWATSWKAYYHPFELSERLAVCPSWEQFFPRPGQKVLRLDPGMAFGTGTHETTRLCLSLIEQHLTAGMRVLDVGCGSGILSIAAKLLGSGRTVGVDIDPVAVRVAGENAGLNGCSDIEFFAGDLSANVSGTFNLVCANIVADVILRLAPVLPALMEPDGVCILSGILEARRSEVERGLSAAGLIVCAARAEGGWAAIACKKAV